MKFLKLSLLAATALLATQAHAGVVSSYSYTAVPSYGYAPAYTNGTNTSSQTTSMSNVYTQPAGTTGSFLVVSLGGNPSTNGSATINAHDVASYSFVWGSPDAGNTVNVFDQSGKSVASYTGTMLERAGTSDGDNSNTALFTITGTNGTLIDHLVFTSSNIAFESAAVPEPTSYALVLAGLGGVGFFSRRRNRV